MLARPDLSARSNIPRKVEPLIWCYALVIDVNFRSNPGPSVRTTSYIPIRTRCQKLKRRKERAKLRSIAVITRPLLSSFEAAIDRKTFPRTAPNKSRVTPPHQPFSPTKFRFYAQSFIRCRIIVRVNVRELIDPHIGEKITQFRWTKKGYRSSAGMDSASVERRNDTRIGPAHRHV